MGFLLGSAERVARIALLRSGFESTSVAGSGASRVRVYQARGQGDLPPVVLLHGLAASASAYARVARQLLPFVRRVIVPELPGHGESDHPGRPVTVDYLLEELPAVLNRVLDEPAVVYGNSLGGALAIGYAVGNSERVGGLVLASPAGGKIAEHEFADVANAFAIEDARSAMRFFGRIYHRPPWFLSLVAREFPEIARRPAVREILESAAHDRGPSPEELARLTMPVLLLWGRSEKLLPPSALAYYRRHLPSHARIEEPHAFGHTPQLEVPHRVTARIVEVARQVGGGPKT